MIAPVSLHEFSASASQIATGALAAAAWQGILLAGAAALGLRLLPQTPARIRFAIWFGVFSLIACLPFSALWLPHIAAAATTTSHAWLTIDDRWCFWIAGIWAAASLARAISLAVAAHRVRALWKRARPVPLSAVISERVGRKIELCVSDEVDRPTVIGFFSPRIVIPEWLLERLSPAELDHIVLHEAGHLSRRDDWLNLLQKLALVLFPLNPALVWIERRLCLERELACDERVLHATGDPIAYAECLARIAEYRLERRGLVRGLALALGAVGRESELARRVLSLLNRRPSMKGTHTRFVFGGAMLMLVFAAGAFERAPQLVAFSTESAGSTVHASQVRDIAAGAGFRALAVRAAAVTPAQAWKTSGDTPARLTAARTGRALAPKPMAEEQRPTMDGSSSRAVSYRDHAAVNQPRMVETVATRQQITPNGDVIVTRWVTVSTSDGNDSVPAAAQQRRSQAPRAVRSFAAVPVQGGWLVFRL